MDLSLRRNKMVATTQPPLLCSGGHARSARSCIHREKIINSRKDQRPVAFCDISLANRAHSNLQNEKLKGLPPQVLGIRHVSPPLGDKTMLGFGASMGRPWPFKSRDSIFPDWHSIRNRPIAKRPEQIARIDYRVFLLNRVPLTPCCIGWHCRPSLAGSRGTKRASLGSEVVRLRSSESVRHHQSILRQG